MFSQKRFNPSVADLAPFQPSKDFAANPFPTFLVRLIGAEVDSSSH